MVPKKRRRKANPVLTFWIEDRQSISLLQYIILITTRTPYILSILLFTSMNSILDSISSLVMCRILIHSYSYDNNKGKESIGKRYIS
jgi:hypothetical protein